MQANRERLPPRTRRVWVLLPLPMIVAGTIAVSTMHWLAAFSYTGAFDSSSSSFRF